MAIFTVDNTFAVNLTGMLWDADADLIQKAWLGGTRSAVQWERVWEGARSLPRKKSNFSLETACFGEV